MKPFDLKLPDFSDHPPPPQATLEEFEKCVMEWIKAGHRRTMTDEELIADFLRNEGSQTEEWPDFGG